METLVQVLDALPWFAWIAIAAIAGQTAYGITRAITQHQQRMELIRRGLDPTIIEEAEEERDEREHVERLAMIEQGVDPGATPVSSVRKRELEMHRD